MRVNGRVEKVPVLAPIGVREDGRRTALGLYAGNKPAYCSNCVLCHSDLGDEPVPWLRIRAQEAKSAVTRLVQEGKKVVVCNEVPDPDNAPPPERLVIRTFPKQDEAQKKEA